MYQSHSTAHRIAHDLLVHPDTIRLGGSAMYDAEDDEYPAEATIEFGNGTGLTIFDRPGPTDSVSVHSYSATGLIAIDTVVGDKYISENMQFQGMLDNVVSLALNAYNA